MKITKSLYRLLLLTLVICLLSITLTSCGYAPADTTGSSQKYSGQAAPDSSTNKLLYQWSNALTTYKGGVPVQILAPDTQQLVINGNYGNAIKGGMTAPRDVAIMMYGSIFGVSYNTSEDIFCSQNDAFSTFSLQPDLLIGSVTEVVNREFSNSPALSAITTAIRTIALSILAVFWMFTFINQIVNERFTMESLFKGLMQLIIGMLIITHAEDLCMFVIALSNSIVVNANGQTIPFDAFQTEILNLLHSGPTALSIGFDLIITRIAVGTIWVDLSAIGAVLLMVAPLFAQLMCAYKIVSMLVMRTIELIVRITFAPIPIAFGSQNGFSQSSITYFRKTLACALQPTLMYVGVLCFSGVASAIAQIFGENTNALTGIVASVAMFMSYMILNAYIGETKRMAQEVIG